MKKFKKLRYVKNMQDILSEELQNELVMAIIAGDRETTKNIMTSLNKLLENDPNSTLARSNSIGLRGKTLLHLALEKRHKEIAELLLTYDKMQDLLDQPDTMNITPLMLAVERCYTSIVTALLDKGANPHIKEKKKNQSALLKAISTGNMEITELLLGQKSIKESPWILSEALHHAVKEGQLDIAKLLLQKYQAPNLPDNDGSLVLNWAIFGGNPEIIREITRNFGTIQEQRARDPELSRYLDQCQIIKKCGHIFGLKTKIKVRLPNSKNYIHVDTVNVHVARDLKDALLEYGSKGDPSRTFQDFTKTLRESKIKEIVAIYNNPNTQSSDKKIYLEILGAIVSKCLEHHANHAKTETEVESIASKDEQRWRRGPRSSIYSFYESPKMEVKSAKFILESLTSDERHEILDSLANERIEILSNAIASKDDALISFLTESKPQIALCQRGAAQNNRLEILQFLVDRGYLQKINEPDEQGDTALILAIRNGHSQVVEFLLSHGADPMLSNRRTQESPMILAENGKNRDILQLLNKEVRPNQEGSCKIQIK